MDKKELYEMKKIGQRIVGSKERCTFALTYGNDPFFPTVVSFPKIKSINSLSLLLLMFTGFPEKFCH